ncbi:hypothetical protein GCM10023223_24300 [Stackebrandtia albiflava]
MDRLASTRACPASVSAASAELTWMTPRVRTPAIAATIGSMSRRRTDELRRWGASPFAMMEWAFHILKWFTMFYTVSGEPMRIA